MSYIHKRAISIPVSIYPGIDRTEVLYGVDNVINAVLGLLSKANRRIDSCMDRTRPSLAIEIPRVKGAIVDSKSRGIRMRLVTEITADNVSHCKELIRIIDELRHLEGIKGTFYLSEREYLAPAMSHEKGKPASQIIYSNVKEVLEHQQYVFDSFWSRAVPAEERIREIEEGIIRLETRIIEDGHQIVKEISRLIASSNELHTCLTAGGMQYSYNHFFDLEKKLLEKQKKGEHRGIKYISNIEKDNAEIAKIFLDGGIQIRHVKNLPPISFGVSDKEIAATIEKMEGGRMVQSLLLSNESAYVNHFKSIFEELWKDGIVAAERIKDLETGMQSDIEVIPNSARAREVYLNLVKKAKEEIMIIFPTTGAFIRQSKLGVIELAKEAARLRNTKVRILMPLSKLTDQMIIDLKRDYPYNFHVRFHVEQTSAAKATIVVVDRKDSLVMELRDDSTTTFEEAIGFSTHSNSRPGVLSYVAIFENIWMHIEMFEELKVHERMQQEFINVAAHELRTPIQPIISAASLLSSKKSEISREEMDQSIDLISRNAQRLKQLSDDILDVTKIESHTLQLKKELVDLDEMISNIVQDYRNQIARDIRPINLLYEAAGSKASINIEADRMRLNQVFHNLLSNAIKFTNKEGGGTIYISLKGEEEERDGTGVVIGKNNVYVSIRDTGTGIHPEIFTRLFKKFASKSYQGTGLGLFISKNIIEAHGGKIWGENNADGKGTTFTFSLPISEQTPW